MVDDVNDSKPEVPVARRRRVPRRAFLARIGLLSKGKYVVGRSYEIGEGGMLLGIVGELKIDQNVVVTFKIPGGEQTVVRGIVRYCQEKDQRFGVEFVNLDFNMKRAIRTFVASKSAEEAQQRAA